MADAPADDTNSTPSLSESERLEAAKERDDAHASANKDQEEYDKQLLTLSVGTLTLLLAFIKDIVKLPSAQWVVAFYLACICMFLCVLFVLGSYQYCIWVNRRISMHFAYKIVDRAKEAPYPEFGVKMMALVNLSSGLLFVAGLVSAGTFVLWNIHVERRINMETKDVQPAYTPLPTHEERGQFGKIQSPPANRPPNAASPPTLTPEKK